MSEATAALAGAPPGLRQPHRTEPDPVHGQVAELPGARGRCYRLGLIIGRLADDRGTCLYHLTTPPPGISNGHPHPATALTWKEARR